ncbi:MAG: hypothetical protein HC795_13020 [Coleofasciculaceae cyanobacterium RL_1_1]|nr:hypothetical protein [Coleofasciculaceae cyanobacterium RL_1_1]
MVGDRGGGEMKRNLIPTAKSIQCPICGDHSGKCRISQDENLILCQASAGDDWQVSGFKSLLASKCGTWQKYRRCDSTFDPQIARSRRDEWQARERERIASLPPLASRASKIDHNLSRGLNQAHLAKLIDRGLTREQITHHGFYSFQGGIAGAVRGVNREPIAIAYRLDHPDGGGRYRWGKDSQLPGSGDLPIGVNYPHSGSCSREILYLCEGSIIKPAIASERLQGIVIGFGGGSGNLDRIKPQLREICAHLAPREIRILPDAGYRKNSQVSRAIDSLIAICEPLASVAIGDWNQASEKAAGDIDEISREQIASIQWRSVSEDKPASEPQSIEIPQSEAWQAWIAGRSFTPDEIVNQQYLEIEIPREGEILAVKSGTGTGKTHWIANRVIPAYPDRGFEFIGYRNGLLLQTAAKIEAANPDRTAYHLQRDLKGEDRGALGMVRDPQSILLLCADSMVYHQPSDFDGKIIVIDEPIAVIKHLLQASSMRHRDKIKALWREALQRCYAAVLTDGHNNDALCDYLADLSGKPVRKIENIYRGNKGKIRLLKGTYASDNALKFARANGLEPELNPCDYSPIQAAILNNPGRIAVGSDSQELLELLDRLLQERGKKGIRFDSTTSSSEWAAEMMADVAGYIQREQPDYFLYSPSGEAGLDVSVRGYFDDLYFIFFGVVGTDEQLQFLARVRDPAARKSVWISPSGMGKKSVLSESLAKDIQPALIAYALDCSRESFASDEDRAMAIARHIIEQASDRHFDHECHLLANSAHENAHLRECFTAAALASGYEIEDVIAAAIDDEAINKAKGDMRSEIAAAMHERENLSDSEASRLEGDFAATEGEKLALRKYKLLAPFPGIADREIEHEVKDPESGEIKIESRPLASAELIERLLYKDRDLARKFERRYWLENIELARKHQRQTWIKASERALDPDKPRSLNLSKWRSDLLAAIALRDLGLHHFLAPGFEWDAKSSEVVSLYSLIRKSKRIQRDLNFQPGSQKPLEIVGRLLQRIGVSAKSRKIRDGKLRRRIYSLAPTSLIDEQLQAAVSARLQAKNADAHTTKKMIELSQCGVGHLTPDLLIKEVEGVPPETHTQQGLEGDLGRVTFSIDFSPKFSQNEPPIAPENQPPNEPINQPAARIYEQKPVCGQALIDWYAAIPIC